MRFVTELHDKAGAGFHLVCCANPFLPVRTTHPRAGASYAQMSNRTSNRMIDLAAAHVLLGVRMLILCRLLISASSASGRTDPPPGPHSTCHATCCSVLLRVAC